jgi:murein DD-endopeptidase MepM/ murein hydrolase activator NlpD
MNGLRKIFFGGAMVALLLASATAAAQSSGPEQPLAPATVTLAAAPLQQGSTLVAPTPAAPASAGSGGTAAKPKPEPKTEPEAEPAEDEEAGGVEDESGSEAAEEAALPEGTESFEIGSVPSSSCASTGVPPTLIPIFERAASTYQLGPQGPAVLAGINEVETAFGSNLNVSSAGAVGWMQFIPSSWETYGVDANGDGVRDPYNPEDAIFAAASYLSVAGMPTDTYGAIYAYNHADWYVEEVLGNAACYSNSFDGVVVGEALSASPRLPVLSCRPAADWRDAIPSDYLEAFETAAARYELGRRGVWALAAVARLESDFGRGMTKRQLQKSGPLGLDPTEWATYAVDGDEDGRVRHSDPADSAATLARLVWSRGSIRAGIFTHNQAEWYVQSVLADAEAIEGDCQVHYVDWSVALPAAAGSYVNPFSYSSDLFVGRVDQGVDFTGAGPIVAIGDALVLKTGAPGWPEEGGVLYELLDGPLKGAVIFVYEGVDPTVQPGQRVSAGDQIATFRPGGSIEMGLADSAGVPLSHAEYFEGKVTQSGLQMLSLLQSLGV